MFHTLKKRIKTFLEEGFIQNIAVLMSGTLIAQIITAASMPLLTRLFTPVAFGVLGMLSSVVNLITNASSLRYDMAIMIPEEDDDAANLLLLSFFIIIAICLLTLVAVAIGRHHIAAWVDSPEFGHWLWWAPLMIFFGGIYQTLNFWCSRQKEFKRLSISQVFAAGGSAGAKTGAGFLGMGTGGLVGGQIIGQAAATFVLAYQVFRDDTQQLFRSLSRLRIKALAKKYADFPRYNAPMTLLNGLTNGMPVLLFGVFFGPAVAGYYSIAYLILKIPVTLISGSLRKVYLQRASEKAHNDESLFTDLWQVSSLLFAVGILPVIIAFFLAPWGFEFVLGDDWTESGLYAQPLLIYLLFVLMSTPATALIPVINIQREYLFFQIFMLIAAALGIAIGGFLDSPIIGVIAYAASKSLLNFLIVLYVAHHTRRSTISAHNFYQK